MQVCLFGGCRTDRVNHYHRTGRITLYLKLTGAQHQRLHRWRKGWPLPYRQGNQGCGEHAYGW